MDPAAISALAGALGVVAGSLVSSVGVVLRERLVGRREREVQQALRLQQLADQRATFQRDTILALQDAIGELWALSADAYNRAFTSWAETGEWPMPVPAELPGLNTVSARTNALRARVFDDELRRLVSELERSIWHAVEVADWREQSERMKAAREPRNRMQERVNLLLKAVLGRSRAGGTTLTAPPGNHGGLQRSVTFARHALCVQQQLTSWFSE